MQCEEPGTSSTQVKRAADELEEPDAMVQLMEVYSTEMPDEEQSFIMLENGEWCPEEMSRAGDLKELQGLFDKKVFEIVGAENHQVATS